MGREVEVKLRVDCGDLSLLRERLAGEGARFAGAEREVDTYYLHPCRDFLATDEALRLRRDSRGLVLTYKGPRVSVGGVKGREEIEVEVRGDVGAILERLGFTPGVVVAKDREYYELPGALVTLDRVEGLGCFVEVESRGLGGEELMGLVDRLGVRGSVVEKTYAELAAERLALGDSDGAEPGD